MTLGCGTGNELKGNQLIPRNVSLSHTLVDVDLYTLLGQESAVAQRAFEYPTFEHSISPIMLRQYAILANDLSFPVQVNVGNASSCLQSLMNIVEDCIMEQGIIQLIKDILLCSNSSVYL